ncbi:MULTISPECIES: hypothetical protein [unclassified Streptomyces]|uniref:hypothetical protein n=1 Tax=unclassified Streptomyces TaxID=2593676 RepID=UPI002E1D60AC
MPTRTNRSGLLALLATAGLLAGASQAAASQPESAAPAAARQAASLVYLNTVVDQWSHWTPDWHNESHAGTLYAGRSYFYCYTYSVTYTGNGHTSSVWLRTDDDTGNRNVWVSDVNLDPYGFRYDVNLLPHC